MKRIAAALGLLIASCNPAIAAELDRIEIKQAPTAICQPKGMMPMPCALLFSMMQRMLTGGGCGGPGNVCPVKL